MKIAITSQGQDENALVDERFGRCSFFYIINLNDKKTEVLANAENAALGQGAGIQTAQNLVDRDIKGVITGFCGPKAFRVLEASSIPVYSVEQMTVKEAIELYVANKLIKISAPNN